MGKTERQLKRELRKERRATPEFQKKLKKRKRIRRIILSIIAAVIVLAVIITAIRIHPTYVDFKNREYEILQNMDGSTFHRSGNTYVYDKNDEVIGKIGNEKYEYISVTKISDDITNGYIAQEDKRFTYHHGVDVRATIRAFLVLVKNHGQITQGGSTITQQVVKNNMLTQERTFDRKILEILLALQIEKEYSKSEIMEFYCNSNYYGNNCYGVEGASMYYFGKHANEVTLAEAAMLVGVSNSPNNYNPVASYEKAMTKKSSVLGHMLEQGFISQEEYDQALAEEPEIIQQSENGDADNYMISYAVHCATLQIMKENGFEFQYTFETAQDYAEYSTSYAETYSEISSEIRGNGYQIYTTFDQNIQQLLQQSVDENLSNFTDLQDDGRYDLQGAAVCIDNKSQKVVAMVGGRGTEDYFNRGFLAKRQPGSSIKPLLVYGPAMNEGYTSPGQVVQDAPIDINGYSPSNSGGNYYGNVTVREALARSLNTVAVRLLSQTGYSESLNYLGQMEFSSLAYADSTAPSIALGGFTNGVTVVDMAKGYATIANMGVYTNQDCLRRVEQESTGTVYLYEDTEEQREVYTEDTAFMLTDMMQGVFRESYGTANGADLQGQFYAGKTGTTNDNRDAWFCGFSTSYTCAVWVGCDTPKPVEGLVGSRWPLNIWSSFMNQLHEGKEAEQFEMSDHIYLENSSGQRLVATWSEDIYANRPAGYDYASGILEAKLEENLRLKRIEEEVQTAETATREFEEFQIDSTDDALNLDQRYNELLEIISEIEDSSQQVDFRNRAAAKYELLSGEVVDAWLELIAEEEEQEQELLESQNILDAQRSKEEAVEKLQQERIDLVQWYIDALNASKLYTEEIEKLITAGQNALTKCIDYDEYSSLLDALNEASSKARSLPTENSTNSGNNQSGNTENGSFQSGNSSSGNSQNGTNR